MQTFVLLFISLSAVLLHFMSYLYDNNLPKKGLYAVLISSETDENGKISTRWHKRRTKKKVSYKKSYYFATDLDY